MTTNRIHVIDSHTGGEPTRVVVSGGPELGTGALSERVGRFREHQDKFRCAIVNEPRGSDAMVGALLCEPAEADCVAGVIYFNNVGYLGMCGHGTIGVVATLAYLGKIKAGEYRIDTPCGVVTTMLHDDGQVSVRNVRSYRYAKAVAVDVAGHGVVQGDIAWGGNWFFLVNDHPMELAFDKLEELTEYTWAIRRALEHNRITGAGGAEIDHIELFAPSTIPGVNSKNFVLCPGKAYDRSPCGTGTSAKLACLHEDGKLRPGEVWRQESIVGSVFEGSVEVIDGELFPTIKGSAFVNGEAELILDQRDPFCMGIRG